MFLPFKETIDLSLSIFISVFRGSPVSESTQLPVADRQETGAEGSDVEVRNALWSR